MISRTLFLLAIGLLASTHALAQEGQSLSAAERRIAAHVDAHNAEAVALLERVVNINSGTLNPEGVRAVYEALAPELREIGFEVRYAELPREMGRGGHLVATLRPRDGR